MSEELAKRLDELWEIHEIERDKGIKLLEKIFNNLLDHPHDPKFRNLILNKIRQKLETCAPAFNLLFCAGFGQSPDGLRLQWQNTMVAMKLLQETNAALQAKIRGVSASDKITASQQSHAQREAMAETGDAIHMDAHASVDADEKAAPIDAGPEVELKIWFVDGTEVKPWPEEQYGEFYACYSYVVMRTMESGDEDFACELFVWIGAHASKDQTKAAEDKANELDDVVGGQVEHHRQVQGNESKEFLSCFPKVAILHECDGLWPPSRCEHVLRLTQCLDFYQHVIDGKGCDVLLEYLSDERYPRSLLQTDWTHVLMEHFGDKRTLREAQQQHEQIYEHLVKLKSLKACDLEHCHAFTRNSRDRESEKENNKLRLAMKDADDDDDDDDDTGDADLLSYFVDELDTIHCHLLHSFDCGFRSRARDVLLREDDQTDDEQQGDEKMNDDDEAMPSVHNQALQSLIAATQTARARLERVRGANRVSHSKFVTEIGSNKQAHQESGNNENDDDKEEEKENEKDAQQTKKEKYPLYSYGCQWEYEDETNEWYIKAKYGNLEQEVVTNQTHTIPLSVFKSLVETAKEKMTLEVAKKLKYNEEEINVPIDNPKTGAPITVEHLVAVLLYCDLSSLCYEFSKTFRQIDEDKSFEDMKSRNREYAIWSRLLSEAVNAYGLKIGDSKVKTLYHGVSQKMVFAAGFVPFFYSPTSLTVQRHVAATFATTNGVLLVLQEQIKLFKFFNCSWLSCFSNEDERLVMAWGKRAKLSMKLDSIICMRTASDYRAYVRAFAWFHLCIGGYPNHKEQDYKKQKATKRDGRIVAAMFERRSSFILRMRTTSPFSDYVEALFDAFRGDYDRRYIWINIANCKQYYGVFDEILFASKDRLLLKFKQICTVFWRVDTVLITYGDDNKADLSVFWERLLEELNEVRKQKLHVSWYDQLEVRMKDIECGDEDWMKIVNSELAKHVVFKRNEKKVRFGFGFTWDTTITVDCKAETEAQPVST